MRVSAVASTIITAASLNSSTAQLKPQSLRDQRRRELTESAFGNDLSMSIPEEDFIFSESATSLSMSLPELRPSKVTWIMPPVIVVSAADGNPIGQRDELKVKEKSSKSAKVRRKHLLT